VHFNEAEVIAVQWISLGELERQMKAEPSKFTEWFRDEMQLVGFFKGARASNSPC
jgi:isopentenyldiphosphate isomerase